MINPLVRSVGLKLRLIILFILLTFASGCSEFALLMSGSSVAMRARILMLKLYNGRRFWSCCCNERKELNNMPIQQGKKYLQELAKAKATGKKYIVDSVRAKALGITSNH